MKLQRGKTTIITVLLSLSTVIVAYQLYFQISAYKDLEDEYVKMQKDKENLMKEKRQLSEKLETKSKEAEEYEEILEEKDEFINDLEKEKESLKNEKESLESEKEDLKKQKKSLEKDLQSKKEEEKKLVQLSSSTSGDSNGEWKEFTATYYDANEQSTGKVPGEPGYGFTKSGKYVEPGVTIAVDPNVIPLGSWVEIEYPDGRVERRRADDTGSAIVGNKIDIYIPQASITSGKHKVKVKIL